MNESLTLREAKSHDIVLSASESARLNKLGKELAGSGSLITSIQKNANEYTVEVRDVIGSISLGDRTLHIQPKIPMKHLMYIFSEAGAVPRLDSSKVEITRDTDYASLLIAWFLSSVHKLIKSGLQRDYQQFEEETVSLQGQLLIPESTITYYSGRPYLNCRFDDFVFDNPLNRVIHTALRRIRQIPFLQNEYKKQAGGLLLEMPPIGNLLVSDLNQRIDRNTQRYSEPFELAKQIIEGTGRRPDPGEDASVGFLFNTFGNVEKGILKILQNMLTSKLTPKKGTWPLEGGVTLMPDLVFGNNVSVGDVKYRLYDGSWTRSEVFQLTTYAAEAMCERAVLVGFSEQFLPPHDLKVGKHTLRLITWTADEMVDPREEAERVVLEISQFLTND